MQNIFSAAQKVLCALVTSLQHPRNVAESAQTKKATTHCCQEKEMFSIPKVILKQNPETSAFFLGFRQNIKPNLCHFYIVFCTDLCQAVPCENNGQCIYRVGFYLCACQAGFTGNNCETDINKCDSSPCQNGGLCTDGINSFRCQCTAGFNGTECENDIDECAANPCQNGATCEPLCESGRILQQFRSIPVFHDKMKFTC